MTEKIRLNVDFKGLSFETEEEVAEALETIAKNIRNGKTAGFSPMWDLETL